jgi:hypothetical protein
MSTLKIVLVALAVAFGLSLFISDPVASQDSGACEGACLPGTDRTGPFSADDREFKPQAKPSSRSSVGPYSRHAPDSGFKGYDYGESRREFGRMSVRQRARPYGDLERSRAISGADPYVRNRFGHDDSTGRFRALQERQTRDPHGTGRPGK